MTDMGGRDQGRDESSEPTRELGQAARDHHLVQPLTWLAGASDRGRRHETNQDALSVAGSEVDGRRLSVMVISDGVSSSAEAETAALVASRTAADHLVGGVAAGSDELDAIFAEAFRRANEAVLSAPRTALEPGSCTLIAALADGTHALVGNVGDSRAYFLPDHGTAQVLSTDDSIAQARIELGMSREEAERSFQAHAITRWLGPDSSDVAPRLTNFTATSPGWLMLCSDGLWNYASEAADMADLVASGGRVDDPALLAEALVDWANEQGGRDNITVCLTRLAPALEQALDTVGDEALDA